MAPIAATSPTEVTVALLSGLVGATLRLLVIAPFLYGFYFAMTLKWRRRERAVLILDLLELGRLDGKSPAETLAGISAIEDRRLPVRLHLLAAHLQNGLPLEAAFRKVPSLLPSNVQALLETGLRHGDPARTYQICRQALVAPLSRGHSALICLTLLLGFACTAAISTVATFQIVVQPKLRQILVDLSATEVDVLWFDRMQGAAFAAFGITFIAALFASLAVFQHVAGPRIPGVRPIRDRLQLWIPWHRDRLHRDFAAMLAFLLDAGVPEPVAVDEAAAATGNGVIRKRSRRVVSLLSHGEPLPAAIRQLDRSGEFRWRLETARHGSGGSSGPQFTATLRGWLAALDARASQLESNAFQATLCGLLISFGIAVGLHCAGVLGWLVAILESTL